MTSWTWRVYVDVLRVRYVNDLVEVLCEGHAGGSTRQEDAGSWVLALMRKLVIDIWVSVPNCTVASWRQWSAVRGSVE